MSGNPRKGRAARAVRAVSVLVAALAFSACAPLGPAASGKAGPGRTEAPGSKAPEAVAPALPAPVPAASAGDGGRTKSSRYAFSECRTGCVDVELESQDDHPFVPAYLEAIGRRIHMNLVDPRDTVQRGAVGSVSIRLTIDRRGAPVSSEVVGSAGGGPLERAASESVGRAAPFNPFPPSPFVKQIRVFVTFRYS